MTEEERKLLYELRDNQRSIKQALYGPEQRPDGVVGDIKTIRENQDRMEHERLVDSEETRRAQRNLGFAVLVSGAGIVVTQFLTR